MAYQIILVQYQYSIKILNYFPVSLSVFQNKIKCPKFEDFIVLKRYHFRKLIFFMSIVKFLTRNAKLFTLLNKMLFMPLKNMFTLFWSTLDTFSKQKSNTCQFAMMLLKNKQPHITAVKRWFKTQNTDTATMQCPRRGPALSMHIVNFPSQRAPILCKHTCIH